MQKMTNAEYRAFMMEGTRTGKLATVNADGQPHVAPIWFVMDGDDVIFNTWHTTTKANNIRRNPRVALTVDDQAPLYSFVMVQGWAEILDVSQEEKVMWAGRIGGRYMGEDRAEEFGKRNGVEGELLLRLHVEKIVGQKDLAE